MADTLTVDEGFEIRGKQKRKKKLSKDTNAETFWADFDAIINITKLKDPNPKWGAEKISKSKEQTICSEKKVKRILELYFFDNDGNVFRKSQCKEVPHRPCLTKEELVKLVCDNHEFVGLAVFVSPTSLFARRSYPLSYGDGYLLTRLTGAYNSFCCVQLFCLLCIKMRNVQ